MSDPRAGEEFFLNVAEKLDNPFPDLQYFREHRPVFYYPPLRTWFIFRYDDITALFQDARLSADRMKGFVDAAPAEVRDELRALAPSFERWVMMRDGPDHARLRQFINPEFNATVSGCRALRHLTSAGQTYVLWPWFPWVSWSFAGEGASLHCAHHPVSTLPQTQTRREPADPVVP